jgi:D-beta-D-heptose 7-phosphate kinase/D-beta-D-heptose 1-phosphate adenosyltransferase
VARIESVLDRFGSLRVLVIGDLLLDEYRSGEVDRISPEAPVPVVRILDERAELGGAGNVARGVVALGARCELVAPLGTDAEGARVVRLLADIGISQQGIVRTPGRGTPHKLRVVARGQQMLRLDREERGALVAAQQVALREAIVRLLPGSDVVILQDYDKGTFADGLAAWSIEFARQSGVRVAADPKHDLRRFRGASLVKPNLEEARACVLGATVPGANMPDASMDLVGRRALLEKIQRELGGAEIVLTRGAAGMTALDRHAVATDIGTRSVEVYDVQGAGDTSIASLALCRAAGAELVDACIVANAAAAVAVGKVGTAAVDLEELRRRLPEALAAFEEKS